MVAIFACLEEHISRKDCRCKVAPKAGSWGSVGNVCGADTSKKSGIYLLEEKESPFALKRIITFLSVCACGYMLLLCMKLHHGIIATKGRKSYRCFGWWTAHLSDWRLDGGAYKGASVLSVFKCTQKLQFSSLQLLSTTIAGSAVLCETVTIVYFYTVNVSLFETEIWLKALDTGLCLFFGS